MIDNLKSCKKFLKIVNIRIKCLMSYYNFQACILQTEPYEDAAVFA